MVLMKKFVIVAVLIPSILLSTQSNATAVIPFRNLAAASAILAEADTGMVLFELNKNLRHPADALAKVVMLLLAVITSDSGMVDLSELVEMTESAWFDMNPLSTTQGIMPGEEMSLLDLMFSAYVGSANEACNLIAEHIAGSVEAYVIMMNNFVRDLGCENTYFMNTHGQYDVRQYTTAHDQFVIYREAMSYPLFVEISGTPSYSTETTETSESRRFVHPNSMFNSNTKYHYRPNTSGLTSATYEGGYSYVGYSESDGLSLICVVLGSDVVMFEDDSAEMRNLTEAQKLFEWGFTQFAWRTILSPSDLVDRVPITHGAGADFVNLRPDSSVELLLNNDVKIEDFVKNIIIYSALNDEIIYAPVSAGEVLGEVTLILDGVEYGTVLLVASTNIELHRLEFIRMQIAAVLSSSIAHNIIMVLALLLAGYIGLVIRYNVIRQKRLRKIANAKKKLHEERQNTNNESDERDK